MRHNIAALQTVMCELCCYCLDLCAALILCYKKLSEFQHSKQYYFQLKPEGGQIINAGAASTSQTINLDPNQMISKLTKPELLEKVVAQEISKSEEDSMVASQVS